MINNSLESETCVSTSSLVHYLDLLVDSSHFAKSTQVNYDHSSVHFNTYFFEEIDTYLLFPNKATRAKNEVTVKLIRPGTIWDGM